jgi:hypothetical protein
MKYQSKPIIVEAMQIPSTISDLFIEFLGNTKYQIYKSTCSDTLTIFLNLTDEYQVSTDTEVGNNGDWVIKEPETEEFEEQFSLVSREDFQSNFELLKTKIKGGSRKTRNKK